MYLYLFKGDVDKESTNWFADIKANLGRTIALRELRPGLVTWISRLNKYIRMYGLKFPKHDHIALIQLLMKFVTTQGKSCKLVFFDKLKVMLYYRNGTLYHQSCCWST